MVEWNEGTLEFLVTYETGDEDWIPFDLLKHDEPLNTARYISERDVETFTHGRYNRWARGVLRATKRVAQRMRRMQTFEYDSTDVSDSSSSSAHVRHTNKSKKSKTTKKKKPGRNNRNMGSVKYGIRVPKSVEHARQLDKENGNDFWERAIQAEMDSLNALQVFRYFPPDHKPGSSYQYAPLRMVFDVKADLRRKACILSAGKYDLEWGQWMIRWVMARC